MMSRFNHRLIALALTLAALFASGVAADADLRDVVMLIQQGDPNIAVDEQVRTHLAQKALHRPFRESRRRSRHRARSRPRHRLFHGVLQEREAGLAATRGALAQLGERYPRRSRDDRQAA